MRMNLKGCAHRGAGGQHSEVYVSRSATMQKETLYAPLGTVKVRDERGSPSDHRRKRPDRRDRRPIKSSSMKPRNQRFA